MLAKPPALVEYHAAGKPLACSLEVSPYGCEFWPLAEVDRYNVEYEVPTNAPGYLAFGTSGGGEMYCLSPSGKVVCLAFVGMSAKEELFVASSWEEFELMLQPTGETT